ncbi:hypothetical protein ABH973_000106 [Bradyrhizobium ottawaense]
MEPMFEHSGQQRLYLSLRKLGRRIRRLGRGVTKLLRILFAIWPVSLVSLALSFCFLLPGLAARQSFEALYEYASYGESEGIIWGRYLITVAIAMLVGTVLSRCSIRLLSSYPLKLGEATTISRVASSMSLWFPSVALAAGFFFIQSTKSGWFYPYGLMAVGLIVARPLSAMLYRKAKARGIEPPTFLNRLTPSKSLAALILVVGPVVLFSSQDKDYLFGVPISSIAVAQHLGPVNILLIFFATFTLITSALTMAGRFLRLPLTTTLVVLAVVFSWYDLNDNHPIRRAAEKANKKPEDVQTAFEKWLVARPDLLRFDEYPVFVVSAEGGGIRAAFFTAVTLGRIVDRCPRMANHFFAISGVSGGAIGAALFAAALEARPPNTSDRRCDLTAPAEPIYEKALAEILTDDHLTPLISRMLFPDMLQRFLPFPVYRFDRQLGLELSLERSFRRVFGSDVLARPIYNLEPSPSHPFVPYLLMNMTEVNSGRRFIMTPLFLRTIEFNGVEDWHLLDWDRGPPVSTAAATSARFPVFSPAGYYFNNGRKARYVDGGYADNSGAISVAELYRALYLLREQKYVEKDQQGNETTKFAFIAIHIGNAPACNIAQEGNACEDIDEVPPLAGGLGELLSPLRTVINVRSAQVEYTLRRLHTELDQATEMKRFDFHSRVQLYDRGVPVPLGWLLSNRVASELRSQLDPYPGWKDCKTEKHESNLCALVGAVAPMTWEND